jgi:hypothetical protein
VVQTAWAVLGLLACECSDRAAIDRGVQFIMDKQVCLCVFVCVCVSVSVVCLFVAGEGVAGSVYRSIDTLSESIRSESRRSI